MRFKKLTIDGKSIISNKKIEDLLLENHFYWLLDSEFEEAEIEIKKSTLIWHSGTFYSGNWEYGIFKEGVFYGNFINGIFENGVFKGTWKSGINLQSLENKN